MALIGVNRIKMYEETALSMFEQLERDIAEGHEKLEAFILNEAFRISGVDKIDAKLKAIEIEFEDLRKVKLKLLNTRSKHTGRQYDPRPGDRHYDEDSPIGKHMKKHTAEIPEALAKLRRVKTAMVAEIRFIGAEADVKHTFKAIEDSLEVLRKKYVKS